MTGLLWSGIIFPMTFMFYTVYLEDLSTAMNLVYMEMLSSKYYGSSINPSNG